MALSNKEKQAAFRKRNAELGRSELRGIMATEEEQKILKAKIKEILIEVRQSI